jgi:hypothetical protein
MTIRDAVCATSVVAILLIASRFCSAQDKPLGDVAREARAQKSEAQHTKKVITNDDLRSDRVPVQETDDPVTVVGVAWQAFLADAGHTCHGELTNNSGPGSLETSLIEAQGQDRVHMVINAHGGIAGDSEVVVIGSDKYGRFGTRPWQKYTDYVPGEIPFGRLSEIVYDSGLKLVGRETFRGSLAFVYENKYHPGGVDIRNTTDDIWIGANDHRILKAEMLFTETHPSSSFTRTTPAVSHYTVTCSYGPVPEIKPPI